MRSVGYIVLAVAALAAAIWIAAPSPSQPTEGHSRRTGIYQRVSATVGACDGGGEHAPLPSSGLVAVRDEGSSLIGVPCTDESACGRLLENPDIQPLEEPGAWHEPIDARWLDMPWRVRSHADGTASAKFVSTSSSPRADAIGCTAFEIGTTVSVTEAGLRVEWSFARSKLIDADDCIDAPRECRAEVHIELALAPASPP